LLGKLKKELVLLLLQTRVQLMHALHRLKSKLKEFPSQVRPSFLGGFMRSLWLLGEKRNSGEAAYKKALEAFFRKDEPMQLKGLQHAHINMCHARGRSMAGSMRMPGQRPLKKAGDLNFSISRKSELSRHSLASSSPTAWTKPADLSGGSHQK
jgi:hypothetical protein